MKEIQTKDSHELGFHAPQEKDSYYRWNLFKQRPLINFLGLKKYTHSAAACQQRSFNSPNSVAALSNKSSSSSTDATGFDEIFLFFWMCCWYAVGAGWLRLWSTFDISRYSEKRRYAWMFSFTLAKTDKSLVSVLGVRSERTHFHLRF